MSIQKIRLQDTEKNQNKSIKGHLLLIINIAQTLTFVKEYLNQFQQVKKMWSFHKSIAVLEESVKINSNHLHLLIMELKSWEAFIIATVSRISITTGVEVEVQVQRAAINT